MPQAFGGSPNLGVGMIKKVHYTVIGSTKLKCSKTNVIVPITTNIKSEVTCLACLVVLGLHSRAKPNTDIQGSRSFATHSRVNPCGVAKRYKVNYSDDKDVTCKKCLESIPDKKTETDRFREYFEKKGLL